MSDKSREPGQINVLAGLAGIGTIVGAIWVWNHLSFDTQDRIIDDIMPVLVVGIVAAIAVFFAVRSVRTKQAVRAKRDRLVQRFQQERSHQTRQELAFALVELNQYEREGLESIAAPMADVFISVANTALGDKQHRIRGMAVSYLGVLEHRDAIPLLIKKLEDDHAHVRASAALALGRMRALEAHAQLQVVMKDDWDQTVRSRAREAFERIDRIVERTTLPHVPEKP